MFFVTNRTPREGPHTEIGRTVSFDLRDNNVSQGLYFCERSAPADSIVYKEIGYKALFSRLKETDAQQILLYIHGFNISLEGPDQIFDRVRRLQKLINNTVGRQIVQAIPLIWPCYDDPLHIAWDDYWDSQQAADYSGCSFARMLGKFSTWRCEKEQLDEPCTKRINVLAHSMGTRVVRNALLSWANHYGDVSQLFRNVFLVAADMANNNLEDGKDGQFIPHSARNVVVYYANDDLVMPASKLANLGNRKISRRMGMTGPRNLNAVPRTVYEVDCDDFNNTIDFPRGHTYFLEGPDDGLSPALRHMISAIQSGRVTPGERSFRLRLG